MIRAIGLCKDYKGEHGMIRVLDGVSFEVARGEKIAVLGRNGAGKSTLVKLLAGVELPTAGRVEREMSMSWPLGFSGGFQGGLTGNDNIRFIARIYGKPIDEVRAFVDDFAELGKFLAEPVMTYSAGMRARLAFGLSIAIEFDCYLIDELLGVGDQRFQRKSFEELFEKRSDRSLIMVGHFPDVLKQYCDRALVLHRGRGKVFSDLDLALDIYSDL